MFITAPSGNLSTIPNGNSDPGITEGLWGQSPGDCFGYSHAVGGFAGSHAEYMRIPYADVGCFVVPDEVSDTRALFASDSVTTGWTGAELGGARPGDTVAVWGAGAVGQMAARAAMLLGAEQVVVIDRIPEHLEQVRRHIGAETVDYSTTDVVAELRERTPAAAAPTSASRPWAWRRTVPDRRASTTRSSSRCGCKPTGRPPSGRRSGPAARAAACSCWASSPSGLLHSRLICD